MNVGQPWRSVFILNEALLLAASKAKILDFSNIEFFSVPGTQIADRYMCSELDQYSIIAPFIAGDDIYNGHSPSNLSVDTVVETKIDLATDYSSFERVVVLRFPPRYKKKERFKDQKLVRHFAVNRKLEKLSNSSR